ncbi:MAG: GAF domain-containing protein [Chloroflexi bacterium]|nr:GAF domain-containing protein [Chloroflexota bacterium]MCC6893190.1 GAF domain-containing protein [Anaerolineae bacterium]
MVMNPVAVVQRENARLQAENDLLHKELKSLRDFVDILNELADRSRTVVSDEALLPLLESTFTKALGLLNAPDGSLMLLDEDTNELVFVLVRGSLAGSLKDYRVPADEGIAGWVIKQRTTALVRDVRRDGRFSDSVDSTFKFRTQSIAAAPLVGDGKVYGVIEALNQPGDEPFSDSDLALLGLLCRFAGEILADIERKQPAE